METLIREATIEDMEAIFRVEKRSYPPELQAPHRILIDRFETFGIRVAQLDGEVVGFYTCVPVVLDLSYNQKAIELIKQNRNPHYTNWFEQYKLGGSFNTLYVTSTAVSSSHQGRGIGKKLVKHSLELAKNNDLEYRASVLRIPKLKQSEMDVDEYLTKVHSGEIINKMLSLYLSLGFTLGPSIRDYEQDRTSANCGVLAFKHLS